VFVFPSRRVLRKRSGRSNTSAAETVAHSENCRARAFSRCCWGCCTDACADTPARSANGRARAYSRFLHARGTIPLSAPARSYIRRMAEHGRTVRCCWGCCSDACADATARSANGRARAWSRLLYDRGTIPLSAPARLYIRRMAERRRSAPPVVGDAVPTLAPDASERCGSVGIRPCGGYGPYSQPVTRLGYAVA